MDRLFEVVEQYRGGFGRKWFPRGSVVTRNAGYSRKPDKQLELNTNQSAQTSEND